MNNLSFGNSAAVLRTNGYAPAPLDSTSRPFGPYAVMQLDYSQDIYAEDAVGVLTSAPPARSEHDPIQDHGAIALAVVSVRTSVAARDVDAIIARHSGKRVCPVRMTSCGASHYVFAFDGELHLTQQSADIEPIGSVSVSSYGSFIELGAPNEWRGGIDLLNTPRKKLAMLDGESAAKLFDELSEQLQKHVPAYTNQQISKVLLPHA